MHRQYWFILLIIAILSPLGLLANGTAWGEWDAEGLQAMLGYVPQGMEHVQNIWQAIFPDYSIRFLGESILGQYAGYILSALIGSVIIYTLMLFITKILAASQKPAVK
ncbi:MAG: domain containing protein [Firmicutes bacterium]|nr:domain containing protein [Bacillota bacterium]